MDRTWALLAMAPLALSIPCCIAAEPPPTHGPIGSLEVTAVDASGLPSALDALPRWATIQIVGGAAIADPGGALFLLEGTADQALLEDLGSSPLRTAHLARGLTLRTEVRDDTLLISPASALTPGAYSLALGAWARDRAGERIVEAPALWALRVSNDDDAGASVRATFPPDGVLDLGTNLDRVVVAFDGAVQQDADALWLELPDGLALAATTRFGACRFLEGLTCATLTPTGRPPPGSTLRLVVSPHLRDLRGGPVGPFEASLHVGTGPDAEPPSLILPSCAIDEQATPLGCVLANESSIELRIELHEAATLEAVALDSVVSLAADPGEVVVRLAPLPPDTELAVTLRLRDAADNDMELQHPLSTTGALPTLSIAEVLADPRGPEPAQELVELLNYGLQPVDLYGIALADASDEPGTEITRSVSLPPGKRVLLVADGFDPSSSADVPPPPGALRIPLGRALAGNGLSNAGEALYLRDAAGRRLSAAPAAPRPRAGVCLVRVGADPRSGDRGQFSLSEEDGCTPGW